MIKKLFAQAYSREKTIMARLDRLGLEGKTTVLYNDPEYLPSYLDGTDMRPPSYIRHIVSVNNSIDYISLKEMGKELNYFYEKAVRAKYPDDEKKYKGPIKRFPVFTEDVLYARMVRKQSFKSIPLNRKEQTLLIATKGKWNDPLTHDEKLVKLMEFKEQLRENGISSEVINSSLYAAPGAIHTYANTDKQINIRTPSGTQYKVHIKYIEPEVKSKTLACGFIITNNEFVVHQSPPALRETQIEDISTQIKLPCYTGTRTFWKMKYKEKINPTQ